MTYEELSRAVRRERETETRVRAMDAHEIVEEIHKHEDNNDRLREINAELLAALKHIEPKMRRALLRKDAGSRNNLGEVVHAQDRRLIAEMRADLDLVEGAIARAEREDR